MKLQIAKEYEYIPTWNGNRECDEPVKVQCKSLTEPERRQATKRKYIGGQIEIETDTDIYLKYGVQRIEGLEVNGEQITDYRKLIATPGLAGLCEELAGEIATNTMVPNLKNL